MPLLSSSRSSRVAANGPWEFALRNLKVLCGKALHAQAIAATEVSAIVHGLRHKPEPLGLWTAVGQDSLAGLVALFGLALRRSCPALVPQTSSDSHATFGALRFQICMGILKLGGDAESGLLSTATPGVVAQGLIRTHCLRCYSVLISQAAAQLQRRRSQHGIKVALDLLTEVDALSRLFLYAEGLPRSFDAELYAEFRASGLLEHLARLMLLLVGGGEAGTEMITQAAGCLQALSLGLSGYIPSKGQDLVQLLSDSPSFAYLLSSHVVGLCGLLDGGGSLYGMPAAMHGPVMVVLPTARPEDAAEPGLSIRVAQWVLRLWTSAMEQGRQQLQEDLRAASCSERSPARTESAPHGEPTVAAPDPPAGTNAAWRQDLWRLQVRPARGTGDDGAHAVPASVPAQLRRWLGCAAAPPLNTRAVFELSLRLAAAAVRQVREEQPPPQQRLRPRSGGASAGVRAGRPPHKRIVTSHAWELAVCGLVCAHDAAEDVAVLPHAPRWVSSKLEAYWRLLLQAVEQLQHTDGGVSASRLDAYWGRLMELMVSAWVPQGGANELPSPPSPDVAACLNAGWVGCVERLLRRLASRPLPLPLSDNVDAAFCQVLAFGRQRDVLSLLASAAKRVRLFARRPPRPANLRILFEACLRDMQLLLSQLALGHLALLPRAARPEEARAAASVVGAAASPTAGAASNTGGKGTAARGGGSEAVAGIAAATGPGGANTASGVSTAAADSRACVAAGGAESGGLRQLRVAVSFVVVHLLPAMCRAFDRFPTLADLSRRSRTAAAQLGDARVTGLYLAAWLPLLAAAHSHTDWGGQVFDARALAPVLWHAMRWAASEEHAPEPLKVLISVLRNGLRALSSWAPALLTDMMHHIDAIERGLPDDVGGGGGGDGVAASSGAGADDGSAGAGAPVHVSLLRRVLGTGGAAQDAELLAAVEALCRGSHGARAGGDASVSAGGRGGSDGASEAGGGAAATPGGQGQWQRQPVDWVRLAQLLVPPAELAALLPLCGNPACINLAGDSEVELPLTVPCGGAAGGACRLAYCSAGCREEHAAKGGHRERCPSLACGGVGVMGFG